MGRKKKGWLKKKAELLNKNERKEWMIKNYVNKTKTNDKKKKWLDYCYDYYIHIG